MKTGLQDICKSTMRWITCSGNICPYERVGRVAIDRFRCLVNFKMPKDHLMYYLPDISTIYLLLLLILRLPRKTSRCIADLIFIIRGNASLRLSRVGDYHCCSVAKWKLLTHHPRRGAGWRGWGRGVTLLRKEKHEIFRATREIRTEITRTLKSSLIYYAQMWFMLVLTEASSRVFITLSFIFWK